MMPVRTHLNLLSLRSLKLSLGHAPVQMLWSVRLLRRIVTSSSTDALVSLTFTSSSVIFQEYLGTALRYGQTETFRLFYNVEKNTNIFIQHY